MRGTWYTYLILPRAAQIQNIVTKLQHLSKIIAVYGLSKYSALMKDIIFDRMNIDTFFEG